MKRASPSTSLRATVSVLMAPGGVARTALPAIFAASVVLRVVILWAASPELLCDAEDYYVLAKNLAEGRGYMQVVEGDLEEFNGFTFRAYRSPGYPALLAAAYSVFGWKPWVGWGINIVADLLTQVCGVLIAARLFGRASAVIVAALLAIHVLWTPSLMTECVYAGLFTALAMMVVYGVPLSSWRGALGFGLVFVAALFVRPITVCFLPVLIGQAITRKSGPPMRRLALLGVLVAPSVFALALWGARNYRAIGSVVLLTTNFGHHNSFDFGIDGDRAFGAMRSAGLNEAQINAALLRMEREVLRSAPYRYGLALWARRVRDLFSLQPAVELWYMLWRVTLDERAGVVGEIYRASYWQYYVTYVLAGVGAGVLIWRRRGLSGLWLLMASFVALHACVSRGDVRLLAPLYPLMCVVASGAWPRRRVQPFQG